MRVLKGEEHAGLGTNVGGPCGDVVALEQNAARGDLILGASEECGSEGRLARAIWAHQGMDFSGADGEVNAAQDLDRVLASRGDVELLDSKEGGHEPQSRTSEGFALPP